MLRLVNGNKLVVGDQVIVKYGAGWQMFGIVNLTEDGNYLGVFLFLVKNAEGSMGLDVAASSAAAVEILRPIDLEGAYYVK
jgi:hypothetical protein